MSVGTETSRAHQNRLTTWLAWAVAGLGLLLAGIALYLFLFQGARSLIDQGNALTSLVTVSVNLTAVGFTVLGLLVTVRQGANRVGRLMLLGGLFMNLGFFSQSYSLYSLRQETPLAGWELAAWLGNLAWVPALGALFLLLPLLFPNGRFLTARWRRFAWLAVGVLAFYASFEAFAPGRLDALSGIGLGDNPFALLPESLITQERRDVIQTILFISMVTVMLVANASVLLRWRRSQGEERQQIKWVMLFLGYFVTAYLPLEIYGAFHLPFFESIPYAIAVLALWLGYPLVLGLAILKYRLYDVDLIIRRTVLYALLTASLLGIYYASVVLVQAVITAGSGQDSSVAVAVATLVAAALFSPLRGRLQAIIDRRFYRRKYDAAQTLTAFGAAVRNEVDLDRLTGAMVQAVDETMQPELISLWLAPSGREQMGGNG